MSLDPSRSLHLSDTFCISCGTVTLDTARAKILLIRWSENQEIYLPKGRKNIGETLEDAALRETYEETGSRVTLFRLPVPTLATLAGDVEAVGQMSATTESVAISQRLVHDKLKIIFWFAARGDSTAVPETGTQQEGEDFEPLWVDLDSGVQSLTYDDDKQIARAVIDIVSTSRHLDPMQH